MVQMKAKVLVVDDDVDIRRLVSRMLEGAGYTVRSAADGQEALKTFFAWQPDLAILDLRMPNMDGWKLLERIREVSETAVIIVSGLTEAKHKARGLFGGADDYLDKPFSRVELLARVEAVLRRSPAPSKIANVYRDTELHIDFQAHRVHRRGSELQLSPTEFRLLAALVRNAGAVLSADTLLDLCWEGKDGGPENVRVYIGFLRKKLEDDPANPQLIETIREFGYRYCAPGRNT